MLNLILPPLIIVLAIVVLIVFVTRRARSRRESMESMTLPRVSQSSVTPVASPKKMREMAHGKSRTNLRVGHLQQFFVQSKEGVVNFVKRLFKKNPSIHTVRDHQVGQSPDVHSAQELLEQSTLSFIRRRVLLQEQKRKSVQGGDTESIGSHSEVNVFDEEENALIVYIADNPTDINAYEQLGNYYFKNNQTDDARQCFKQILKLQPRNRLAQSMIKKLESSQMHASSDSQNRVV